MKKLMFGLAAIAGVATCGAIESENIVGYTSIAAGENLNFYAPQFFSVGQTTTDINTIVLNDSGAGMVGWGDIMQVVGPMGDAAEIYFYWDPSMDPNGEKETCYWGDGDANEVSISFDAANAIAIDNMNGYEFTIENAGDVPANDVSFTATENLNWSGNPYPSTIQISSITLDDGGEMTIGWGDTMQIVGPMGDATEIYFYWDASMDPSGEKTSYYWGDGDGNEISKDFSAGDGFAIDNKCILRQGGNLAFLRFISHHPWDNLSKR